MRGKQFSLTQLFGTLVLLFVAFLVAFSLQAWTGPTGTAPSANVSAPINVGATDQIKNAGLSVNALTVFGGAYVQDDLGVGQTNPIVALDVNGTLRLGNGGELCQSVSAGAVRYNSSSNTLEYCNGSAWTSTGGSSATSSYSVFTSSGTWTKPSGLSGNEIVMVELWGGGGGGGGGPQATRSGGGGGGGACAVINYRASDLSSTETVTVGSGGAGGVGASLGSVGGTSSFGTHISAYGGGGGDGRTTVYGSGGGGGGGIYSAGGNAGSNGTAGSGGQPYFANGYPTSFGGGSGGDASGDGGPAMPYVTYGGGGGGYGTFSGPGSSGGSTYCGGGGGGGGRATVSAGAGGVSLLGGSGGVGGTNGNGSAGNAPGGGGGGGSGSSYTGGAGARGEVRVWVIK